MKLNKAAAIVLAGTFIGVTGYSVAVPTQVQAKASYQVQITKNAYVYTSKGKKTKTVYKKEKVLTAYKVRKIKGEYYYDLGKDKYVRTSYAKKYYYLTSTQTKKITRTIKMYQPKGVKMVKQNAYVKRTVKTNLKTHKKTYDKWGSASWKAYKAPVVSGYTASPKEVAKEKVYSWSKNKTVKVKYKKQSKKYYYRTSTQTKKITRTIKMYQPKGVKTVTQSAYVKRTVKTNLKTGKKTYGKWGSASWKAYKAPVVSGYTASPKEVAKEKVYSWSKNKTVKVKYKKNPSKQATKTPSSSSSSSSTNTSAKSTTSDSKKVNPWTEEKSATLRQEILKVINDFRSQVGRSPVTLNNDFNDILDARSLERSKFTMQSKYGVNHDGYETIEKAVEEKTNGKFTAAETLAPIGFSEYDSDKKQISAIVDDYKTSMQEEKDDDDAINIYHTRDHVTNPNGTVGHYWMMTYKPVTEVAIGVACYGPSGKEDMSHDENYSGGNLITLVIEFLYEP